MSFRGRLTVFFLAIVVVPMIALVALALRVADDAREGKADARLATGAQTARGLYADAQDRSAREAERVANLDGVGEALLAGDRGGLETLAADQLEQASLAALRFIDTGGQRLAAAGSPNALAVAGLGVEVEGSAAGRIEAATLRPAGYAEEVRELTGIEAIVVSDEAALAGTVAPGSAELPRRGDGETVELADGEARVAAVPLEGAPPGTRLVLAAEIDASVFASEPLALLALLAFFGLATALILLVLRMLQGQIAAMLAAAKRIGTGDFSGRVPVEGKDEMAELAGEFNKMSDRLVEQMDELKRQRLELEQSIRRIGEAAAAGLDRTALLEIVADTALTACRAEAVQIRLRGGEGNDVSTGQHDDPQLRSALEQAAHRALDRRVTVTGESGKARAIAHPLSRPGDREVVLGTMAVARRGERFDEPQREVLRYLIGQAAVSVENIGLHERVAQQALTDELTGLSNNRHFRGWIDRETARASRFGEQLSLVLLDIDDFKRVNDEHGHLQGDEVLAEIGRVLQLESRGIDEAARYGGEEFVLALPETPKDGAVEVAERVRERIEATTIAGVDGRPPLTVTASLGVATMPVDGNEPQELIAAADAALYQAKRSGKNRVVGAAET